MHPSACVHKKDNGLNLHSSILCVTVDTKESEGGKEEEEKEEEVVVVEEMEVEEPDEPPRPSLLDRAITKFQEEAWPKIRFLFTFKIDRDGRVGIFLRVFGCIMAFLSCFTITYQVPPTIIIIKFNL